MSRLYPATALPFGVISLNLGGVVLVLRIEGADLLNQGSQLANSVQIVSIWLFVEQVAEESLGSGLLTVSVHHGQGDTRCEDFASSLPVLPGLAVVHHDDHSSSLVEVVGPIVMPAPADRTDPENTGIDLGSVIE
jgi:hypothetical protein